MNQGFYDKYSTPPPSYQKIVIFLDIDIKKMQFYGREKLSGQATGAETRPSQILFRGGKWQSLGGNTSQCTKSDQVTLYQCTLYICHTYVNQILRLDYFKLPKDVSCLKQMLALSNIRVLIPKVYKRVVVSFYKSFSSQVLLKLIN